MYIHKYDKSFQNCTYEVHYFPTKCIVEMNMNITFIRFPLTCIINYTLTSLATTFSLVLHNTIHTSIGFHLQ